MRLLCRAGGIIQLPLLLLLSACASDAEFHTRVTRFHTPGLMWQGKTFVVESTPKQQKSLEMQRYALMLADQLKHMGMRQVSVPPADYAVRYRFRSGHRKTTMIDGGIRGYGWDFGYRYGAFAGPYAGWGLGGPIYPLPMDRREISSLTTYPHRFTMQWVDLKRKDMPIRFEGSVLTESYIPEIHPISQCLVAAMFTAFPGQDGETESLDIPLKNCQKIQQQNNAMPPSIQEQ